MVGFASSSSVGSPLSRSREASVISRVDAQLRREAHAFRLSFTCEQCVNYDEDAMRCVHGYPVEPHSNIDLSRATEVSFCKEFELG
jgi:hypothetical protein